MKNNSFARSARAFFIFGHFTDFLVLPTTWNMYFLTVERANKAEIYISTAREQKSLGTIGVRHDGYHVSYKVLVRHVGAILGLHQFR